MQLNYSVEIKLCIYYCTVKKTHLENGSLLYLKSNLLYQCTILIFIVIFRLHVAGKDPKIIA